MDVSSAVRKIWAAGVALVMMLGGVRAHGYSVLTHEEVVDMAWEQQIVPLLVARFGPLTPEQLREAHAYAYGGSILQDIGYYPNGSKEFSDLLHYVRTNEFVGALFRNAKTADDFAFACGALAHFYGDTLGHPMINRVTAQEYPQLKKKFGSTVTYYEDPTAHLRTEFGFDVVEVAHGRYEQQNYRDFIGFQVDKPLMEAAFQETYGLEVKAVMPKEDQAIGSYRWAVSQLIPKMTHVALAKYRKQIRKENPTFDARKFEYRLRRTEYEKLYGTDYQRVHISFGAHVLALIIDIVPKVGPFRAFKLTVPTPKEQDEYLHSVNEAEDAYRAQLKQMMAKGYLPTAADVNPVQLMSLQPIDLDTGKPTAEGEYALADKTYAELAVQLAELQTAPPAAVTQDVLAFFAGGDDAAKKAMRPEDATKLDAALVKLKAAGSVAGW